MDVTSNNAFVLTNTLTTNSDHSVVLSNSPAYQTGALGQYYYPANLALIHAGSRTAGAAGLYHYTVTTNNVIEGTNMVSIGFHYIATDSNGNPLETYWQGIADYLADTNGELGTWEMYYFGHLGLDPNASFDGQGNTVLYDYQHGLVPNIISFQICFTNQYVNLTNAPLSLASLSGLPYYWAVLLDNTNFSAASWTLYTSSNITANLGTNQGWHTVWVGLAAGSQQAWNAVRLDLDLRAPILVVTNATNVMVPMIQLQGYANEELASLSFDLSNANGSISNQPGYMTGAIFDTNSFSYTNNSFKCFDLVLASGANTVTLHAADLAGNRTNCTRIFNLDYSSKPAPVLQLYWPQNGAQISGSSFTCRGSVDDPTVTLSAQITDSNGDTNVVAGVIERNGNFWVDNMPLATGTNWLTLTATDINNHVTTTNLFVVQSSVLIIINAITDNLNQPTVTVSGTINATNYTVWVNGVAATNFGWNGTTYPWTAYNVPMNGAGSAVVQACAIPQTPTDNNGNGTTNGGGGTNSSLSNPGNPSAPDALYAEINQDKPVALVCDFFWQKWHGEWDQYQNPGMTLSSTEKDTQTIEWSAATGGSSQTTFCTANYGTNGLASQVTTIIQSQWATNGIGTTQSGGSTNSVSGGVTNMGPLNTNFNGPTTFPGLQGMTSYFDNELGASTPYIGFSDQAAVSYFVLQTGGRGLPAHQSLHAIEAQAQAVVPGLYESAYQDWLGNILPYLPVAYIPPQTVTILGQQQTADAFIWAVLPDGDEVNVTPKALACPYYLTTPVECKYTFVPQCQSPIPTNRIRTTIGVGEFVDLSFQPKTFRSQFTFAPYLPTNTLWSASAGSPAQTNWSDITFTAPSNAANVTITTQLPNGQTLRNDLNVLEPKGVTDAILISLYTNDFFPTNTSGAGMYRHVYVGPTNVSFGRVQFMEALTNPASIRGYYADTNNYPNAAVQLMDNMANSWFPIGPDNSWTNNGHNDGHDYDRAFWGGDGAPWSPGGGFSWEYSPKWKVGDAGHTNNVPNPWSQQMTLGSDGSMTIQKFGHTVTRNTNNVYTTNN
jgi:hypothetical protein